MELFTIFLRFAITFALSIIFGLERQFSHKPTGFGTFTFVSVGACGLAITAILLQPENPLPLLGAIVTGIGFLGAGALMKSTDKSPHFTTASSIWLFAIFGLVIGVGEYLIGLLLYAVVWGIILFDRWLETRGIGSYERKIVITTNRVVSQKEIRTLLVQSTRKYKLISLEIDKTNNKLSFSYLIQGRKEAINSIPEKLYEKEWFHSCQVE